MKFNKSKYPILEAIYHLKKGGHVPIQMVLDAEELRNNLDNIQDLSEEFQYILENGEVFYFSKSISDKIHNKEFEFLHDMSAFCESDLSSCATLLLPNGNQYSFRCEQDESTGEWRLAIFLVALEGAVYAIITARLHKVEDHWYIASNGISPDKDVLADISGSFDPAVYVLVILSHIVFKKYAPIEEVVVNKNNKKAKLNNQKYLNESEHDVTIIDSSWFTSITRTKGFDVRGHFALRACGVGRKNRRLVWIKAFKKDGYKRQAKKLPDS